MILMALMAYVGETEAGLRAVAPFRALATPYADMLRPMTYPELYPPEDESYHPTAVSRTLFLNRVDLATAAKILQTLQTSEAAFKVAQLRVLGGAMARVPAEATAFAHRRSKIMVSLAAFYEGEKDRHKQDAWVEQFQNELRQEDSGVYVNFIGPEGGVYVQRAYPATTWARLRQVKAKYDPTNLFRLNHNIPPAV
jgi:hypothetical protein